MALRQYRPDLYQNEEHIPKENQARYQAYEEKAVHRNRLAELLFFINIVIFSILTVLSTYMYLSFKIPAFFAFSLGIVTGFVGLRLVQTTTSRQYYRLRAKKLQKPLK